MSDISWKDFLELCEVQTGIINHSSQEYYHFVTGLTTIIGLEQESVEVQSKNNRDSENNNEIYTFGDYMKDILKNLDSPEQRYDLMHGNMKKSLYGLVNSIPKFENSPIKENLFFPVAFSIYQSILILKDALNAKNSYGEIIRAYEDYQKFLGALNLYAQNWNRSDRQLIQSLDFNIKIYNLPVMLNAFYNAFIFNVREILNTMPDKDEESHIYEFLTCPGTATDMLVEELFVNQSNSRRLFMVSIPENQTYNLKLMLIMLVHEVAHFVGPHIRRRESRLRYLQQAFCRLVRLYFQYRMKDWGEEEKRFWDEFEEKLYSDIEEKESNYYTESYMKERYMKETGQNEQEYESEIKKILDKKRKKRYYSLSVNDALLDSMVDIIRNDKTDNFKKRKYLAYWSSYKKKHDKEKATKKRLEVENLLNEYSQELLQVKFGVKSSVNLGTMMGSLIMLFKECLSDVIGIMLLQLTYSQYLDALIQNVKDQGNKEVLISSQVNDIGIRIGLVVATMLQTKHGINFTYGWEDIEVEQNNLELKALDEKIYRIIKRFIQDEDIDGESEIWQNKNLNESIVNYLLDYKLLRYIRKYLFECRQTLDGLLSDLSENKALNMFRMVQLKSISKIMLGLQRDVDDYRTRIYSNMNNVVNAKEDY